MDSKGACECCGSEIRALEFNGIVFPIAKICQNKECIDWANAQFAKEESERSVAQSFFVPPIYADTDPDRLPARLANLSRTWTPMIGKGHLLIHGTTRLGKSRTAWEICRRLNDAKIKITTLTMRDIEYALQEGFQRGNWHKVVDGWAGAKFLFIDDLGKEKLTDRTQSCLFQILDERTAYKRPTIITTNYNGNTLAQKFPDQETGLAFVARLREFFDFSGEAQ